MGRSIPGRRPGKNRWMDKALLTASHESLGVSGDWRCLVWRHRSPDRTLKPIFAV